MSSKSRTSLEEQQRTNSGLVATFQEVTDGFMTLARSHMELAKAEARQEVKAYANQAKFLAIGGSVAAFGLVILHVFGVLLAGLLGGLVAAVVTAGRTNPGRQIRGRAQLRAQTICHAVPMATAANTIPKAAIQSSALPWIAWETRKRQSASVPESHSNHICDRKMKNATSTRSGRPDRSP